MYSSGDNSASFLASTKAAREERKKERDASNAATKIQSAIKGHLERKRLKEQVRQDIANVGKSSVVH